LEINQQPVPTTWNEVIDLTRKGKVAVPAIPIDLLMNFYSFCIVFGEKPFQNQYEVTDWETGLQAIEAMKELYSMVDRKMFNYNPIAVAELMTTTNDYWYCPFAYCYSNYSRTGYAKHLLHYTETISINGNRLKTTIGGTGIAVSSFSKQIDIAVDFAKWIVSAEMQRTFYVQHGGQPGHRLAWVNEEANRLTNNFFKNLLPVMENGYMRPRYNGYLYFQDHAGIPLQKCLMNNSDPKTVLEEMNSIYRKSLMYKQLIAIA
jgi:multiple sugar transport system substrate-binding protein